MAIPSLFVIFITVVFPLLFNVALSFSNMSLSNFHDWEIIGLHHYGSLLGGQQSARFWNIFLKTIVWTVVNVVLHAGLGVLLAVVINGPVRGKSIYRLLLIIPWAVPAYITALTWRGMFDYEFGAVNQAVVAIKRLPAPFSAIADRRLAQYRRTRVYRLHRCQRLAWISLHDGDRPGAGSKAFRKSCTKLPASIGPIGGNNSRKSPCRCSSR